MANVLDMMKQKVAQSGGSRKEILYFKEGTKKRIRFLQEFDTGYHFQFHSDFNTKLYDMCKDPEDHEDCPYCQSNVPLKDEFAYSVFDYDSNEVKIFKFRVTSQSPAPALIEMFEQFGTIMDRDYTIKKVGKGTGSSYVVTPLDKEKFRGKGKAYSEKEVLKILKEAYGNEALNKDDDDEDEAPKKSKKKDKKKVKKEPTLKEKYKATTWEDVKAVAIDFGMTKKEVKAFDNDIDELVEELFDSYEEDDLQEAYDNMVPFDEDDEEDEE